MQNLDEICCLASEMGKVLANRCKDKGVYISTAKLQKMLVIAHGVMMASYNKPLFFEKVSLMEHGVAIKEVEDDFKTEIKYDKEFKTFVLLQACQSKVLDDVIDCYGKYDSFELNDLKEMRKIEKFLEEGEHPLVETNQKIMRAFAENRLARKIKFIDGLCK